MTNGKRLIDANALIEEAYAEGAYGYVDAKQIADAPTARANIVRSCNSKTRTAYGYKWMWETDFCSCGERKDGDGNG